MKLSVLIKEIKTACITGSLDREAAMLTADSRKAGEGAVFVAVKGTAADGHDFLDGLRGKRLAAMVVEKLPSAPDPEATYIVVENSAVALGQLASAWYGHPSRRLKLVGVTGTNGKTTTATLIYEMARLMGFKAGLLSTVVNLVDDRAVPATQTTPDPITLNSLLAQMAETGCTYAAMEVSSHAAHQHRIAGLEFAGGIFTNLTRDHLDYHGTFQAYLQAKKSFFDALPSTAFALTNADDKTGPVMLQNTRAGRHTYSLRTLADFTGRVVEPRLDGTLLSLNGHLVETLFTGLFNAYNLTAVFGASVLLEWPLEQVLVNMSRLVPVAGRFQTFRNADRTVTAVVDYAHTPDAVVNVISAIRQVVGPDTPITTVVGAGGNRDKGKRPIMAAEAARLSDRVILTSDNPRFEKPGDILADMYAGVGDDPAARAKTTCITDRGEAIATAIATARPGEVVLVAGKGHEDYQEVEGVKHHFDDREQVEAALAKLQSV